MTIDDSNSWSLCKRDDCGLAIASRGRVQCWCDSHDGSFSIEGPDPDAGFLRTLRVISDRYKGE